MSHIIVLVYKLDIVGYGEGVPFVESWWRGAGIPSLVFGNCLGEGGGLAGLYGFEALVGFLDDKADGMLGGAGWGLGERN